MNDYRRIYAIGDIHGEFNDYVSILTWFIDHGMDLRHDLFVQIGDFVDGGSETNRVVEGLRELYTKYPEDVVVLLGNHEQFMLDAIGKHILSEDHQIWWLQGGRQTLESYGDSRDHEHSKFFRPSGKLSEDVEWIKTLPTIHETDDYIFVHAGLRPNMSPEGTTKYNRLWIREPFLQSTYDWGKVVVHGHTVVEYPEVHKNRINIDTRARVGSVSGICLYGKDKEPTLFDRFGPYTLEELNERKSIGRME